MSFTLHIHSLTHLATDTPVEEVKSILKRLIANLDNGMEGGEVLDSRGNAVGVFALGDFDEATHKWVPDSVWATIRESADRPVPGQCRRMSQCVRDPGHTGPHIGSTGPAWKDV